MKIEREFTVNSKDGLHARPATLLTQAATKYRSTIKLACGDREANAKSLIQVIALAAEKGTTVTIVADGEDAEKATAELVEIVGGNSDGG